MAETKNYTRSYKVFDLEEFVEKSGKISFDFTPADSVNEATQRVGDATALLKALNGYLREATLKEKLKEVGEGAPLKIVMRIVKPFRSMPPYSDIENRDEQTKSILDMIKSQPGLVETIKTAAAQAEDDPDDDGNEEDE